MGDVKLNYEDLLMEGDENQLLIKEKPLRSGKGRIKGNRIAIQKNMTFTEKACVLAEELGHYHTTVGNILDQSDACNRKQEQLARTWAYNRLIGLDGIVDAYLAGCQNAYEMAEHLEVTEEFLMDTLQRYREKYGVFAKTRNYIIYFEPCIAVLEIQK